MLVIRTGTHLDSLKPQMVLAMVIADQVMTLKGIKETMIISCCESGYSSSLSHRLGFSFDIRLPSSTRIGIEDDIHPGPGTDTEVVELLDRALNGGVANHGDFQVVKGVKSIHVEYRPRPVSGIMETS